MLDALIMLALLVVLYGVGRRCLRAVPFADGLEATLNALGLGFGLLAYATLVLGMAHALRRPVFVGLFVLAAAVGRREIVGGLASGARAVRHWLVAGPRGEHVAVVAGFVLLVLECLLAMAPVVGGDQTKYQLVYPRLFAEAGGFVATPWSFWGYMQYLMNMLFTAAFVLRGDVLARFMNVAYGVLATLAVFALGRRCFGRAVGAWAALLFFVMPFTATLMIRAWVEFALTFYVLLAVAGVLAWRDATAGEGGRRLVVAAIMGGFAAGTKLMGVLAPALLGVVILGTGMRRDGLWNGLRAVVGFGLVALVVAAPCYLRNAAATGNPIFPFGYGIFGGANWSADAARGLDDYYAAYRDTHAQKRGAGAYGSWLEALRFPWDATMAPYAFEKVGRFAYDVGPLLLAFVPGILLVRRRAADAWVLAGLAFAYSAVVVFGMWAHPRYIHPTLPLFLLVAVHVLWTIGAAGGLVRQGVVAILAGTAILQAVTAFRVIAPLVPDSARVAVGTMSEDAFLRRYERRYPLWDLVNRELPDNGNVLVLAMIPHPYHLIRPFTLASPLEQGAIDYRHLDSVDDLAAALAPFGVTHVVREPEEEKSASNPVGDKVVALWDGLLARSEKVAETSGGALYRIGPVVAHDMRTPAAGTASGS